MTRLEHIIWASDFGYALGRGDYAEADRLLDQHPNADRALDRMMDDIAADEQARSAGHGPGAAAVAPPAAAPEEQGAAMDLERPDRFEME